MNDWEKIWNNRDIKKVVITDGTPETVFMNLKKAMGVSKIGQKDNISYRDFYNQFMELYRRLTISTDVSFKPKSFFDVGCGTGCYLYLLSQINKDYVLGGIDYSAPFIKIASTVLPRLKEIYCGHAEQIDVSIKYDCVYSRSIFQYFANMQYATSVVNRMLAKAKFSVGIFDVHDLSKKEEFISFRKSVISDFEKKYDSDSHLFYERSFFEKIAEEQRCKVEFSRTSLPNYWNADFTYDVYFYKNA